MVSKVKADRASEKAKVPGSTIPDQRKSLLASEPQLRDRRGEGRGGGGPQGSLRLAWSSANSSQTSSRREGGRERRQGERRQGEAFAAPLCFFSSSRRSGTASSPSRHSGLWRHATAVAVWQRVAAGSLQVGVGVLPCRALGRAGEHTQVRHQADTLLPPPPPPLSPRYALRALK